jgi:gas vesicle structural protein
MTAVSHFGDRSLGRPSPSSLADVIDTILDKGLVIDIHVGVSLVGIEILTGGSS